MDDAPAHALHRDETKPDVSIVHRKVGVREVDVRRHEADAVLTAFANVLGHLLLIIQHRGEQRRHILPHMVALEPCGLIADDGIAHRMGFVERVVCKIVDLVVDILTGLGGDAIGDTAGYPPLRISMDKGVALLLDLGLLFLGDGPPYHIRLSKGVAPQLSEYLDDLLLIDDTAIGDGQDRNQGGMLIPDQLGIMLAGDESGNGIHGARAVEGDDSGNIFDILRLEPHAYARHAR